MARFYYFGAWLGLAASLSAPIFAQNQKQSNAQVSPTVGAIVSKTGGARVQHVLVRGTGDAMEVEIQTSGSPVAPNTQAIVGPDRIVVDFPGALPASELRALKVNRGGLKGVRAGLFFSNPPITRIVLDLSQPESYQISSIQNAVVVKLGASNSAQGNSSPTNPTQINREQEHRVANNSAPKSFAAPRNSGVVIGSTARLQSASLATAAAGPYSMPRVSSAVSDTTIPSSEAQPAPPKPAVTVTLENGMLHIRAGRATLAQVLFEVQRQTQAEIAIPAGAEQEEVFADIGPAPARDVLGSLLNGSPYNFIFVGNELSLERVILTRREPGI